VGVTFIVSFPDSSQDNWLIYLASIFFEGLFIVGLFLMYNHTEPFDAARCFLTMLLTATGRTYTFKETEMFLTMNGFGEFKLR
jgi:hypothetical protein